MRVTIVDPSLEAIAKDGLKFGNRLGQENIGAHYLVTFLEAEGHAVSFVRTESRDVDRAVARILSDDPELVAMGPYSYNFPFAVKVAAELKARTHRRILIVFGHVHAAMAPETVPEDVCDYIIKGEAELVFADLLRKLEGGDKPPRLMPPQPVPRATLDRLPFPYREERFLRHTPIFFHPPGLRHPKVALVCGSRGCSARCDFCVTPQFFGKCVFRRSPCNIVEELKALQDGYGENIVFHFVDPLFNANVAYPRKLAEAMIESRRQYWCTAMCDFHNLDRELIRLLKRAGFYWLLFGIETFNDRERTDLGKRRGNMDEVLRMCFEEGILTRGFIMLGFPGTNWETLEFQREALWSRPFIGNPRMNFCVPFPGTLLYTTVKRKDLFLTEDWERFTTEEPVIRCPVDPHQLLDFRQATTAAYYLSEKYRRAVAEQIRKFPEIGEVYADAFGLLGLPINW